MNGGQSRSELESEGITIIVIRTSLLFALFATASFGAQSAAAPMFIVERSTNGNVVHYDANLNEDGTINSRDPVTAYWTIGSADGPRDNLRFFERRAWGVKVEAMPEGRYVMRVVSQKQIPIEIYRQPDGTVRAETSISGSKAYLHRIYTEITGPRLFPNVEYIELFGTDVVTGFEVYEKIIP